MVVQELYRKLTNRIRSVFPDRQTPPRNSDGAAGRAADSEIISSWDDLLRGIETEGDWKKKKQRLRQRFLELIRDDQKPEKPSPDIQVHETTDVEGVYTRRLISYRVDEDERAHAYVGVPHQRSGRLPAIAALHGTYEQGKDRAAGLVENPDKAWLDHLARRGYVVIAPDHFVAGHRLPPEGAYETKRFYTRHPEWTAVGKSTFENTIALDVLESMEEVDAGRLGVLGHSLGGHGSLFLAAYDERIRAAVCHCGAGTFRHNPRAMEWARNYWYVYFRHLRPTLKAGILPPVDLHEIIALIAPRAFLDIYGMNDNDPLTQRQRTMMNMKITEVYEREGAPDRFGFYCHGQGHSVSYEGRSLMYVWMDKHLKPPGEIQTRRVSQ